MGSSVNGTVHDVKLKGANATERGDLCRLQRSHRELTGIDLYLHAPFASKRYRFCVQGMKSAIYRDPVKVT